MLQAYPRKAGHQSPEGVSAHLEVPELVIRGTGRRKQHHRLRRAARRRVPCCGGHRRLQRAGHFVGHGALQRGREVRRRMRSAREAMSGHLLSSAIRNDMDALFNDLQMRIDSASDKIEQLHQMVDATPLDQSWRASSAVSASKRPTRVS